jgi:hypothetical protein
MTQFDEGIAYEVAKYLNMSDYLALRRVCKIMGDNIKNENSLDVAIALAKIGFIDHYMVEKYKHCPEIAIFHPQYALEYAIHNGQWHPGEPIILTSPQHSYLYAKDVIGGRWVPGESIILKNIEYASYYAKDTLNQRWPKLEEKINEYPYTGFSYIIYCAYFNLPLTF